MHLAVHDVLALFLYDNSNNKHVKTSTNLPPPELLGHSYLMPDTTYSTI